MLKITNTRRIAQTFFFLLFIWFCVVATLGERWWQLRGWPVNWFLELDPLVGLAVLLATHTLYAGLLWGVVTVVLTLVLGRFFCGWVCPMGTLQQFVGYMGQRRLKRSKQVHCRQPHKVQLLKYWFLIFLLSSAATELLGHLLGAASRNPFLYAFLAVGLCIFAWVLKSLEVLPVKSATIIMAGAVIALGGLWRWQFPRAHWLSTSLQTGLLDPIPFIHRAVNLVLLPLADKPLHITATVPRLYEASGLIGFLFATVVLLCLRLPRFYCRFICPLGALLGLLSRWSVWRMGKSQDHCRQCRRCEAQCEGACAPSRAIHLSECVLCLNCMDQCRRNLMGYGMRPSATGEVPGPDLGRRHVVSAVAAGMLAIPMLRMNASLADNWNPRLIRPPGALGEKDFLRRCIKCGQCMRVCPTNVIHPTYLQAGVEGLWTPALNFRISTSGCQHSCVACSYVCPTAALRPISVDERMGRDRFSDTGPLRIGMAFINRGRCLPWAMDTPCIVCQENCPVSPKAIFTRTEYRPIRNGRITIAAVDHNRVVVGNLPWSPNALSSGDFFVSRDGQSPVAIQSNDSRSILVSPSGSGPMPLPGQQVDISVRLQKPYVHPRHCIGCGVCEHECPVQGERAIRVTAENESRHERHRMVINAP
jgi:polyferredoxin